MFQSRKAPVVPVGPAEKGEKKETPKESHSEESSISTSKSSLTEESKGDKDVESTQNSGMRSGLIQKINLFKSSSQGEKKELSKECHSEEGANKETPKESTSGENSWMRSGLMQKVNPFKSFSQGEKKETSKLSHSEKRSISTSKSSPTEESKEDKEMESTQNSWMTSGLMQKINPFKSSSQGEKKEMSKGGHSEEGANKETAKESSSGENSWMRSGLMQKINPFKSSSQNPGRVEDMTEEVSKLKPQVQDWDSEAMLTTAHSQESAAAEEGALASITPIEPTSPKVLDFQWDHFEKNSVKITTVAEAPGPDEASPQQTDDDVEGLLEWWGTVEGWNEWNESTNFGDEDAEQAVEAAADRVFMAARLFVHLFNQREALLYQRVVELLAIADSADSFHKKTVQASVGGGVASVAGSVTTITGLALAPFTFGTSLIVTAVGIGVATAGGITSASANISDTMHSRTGRAKVEQVISSYQEQIKDIKECLQFLQAGMETLDEWNFEQYVDTISKRAMNKNVKHVMKEGGRAGKALLINTESLINTVQVLGTAGGAAKAAQAMSVTTGVMSGLFLALDVFFLAKDSMELRKGAKTEFAAKIREVCKELVDGLLELKKIKEQLEEIMEDVEEGEEEEEEDVAKKEVAKEETEQAVGPDMEK